MTTSTCEFGVEVAVEARCTERQPAKLPTLTAKLAEFDWRMLLVGKMVQGA